MNRNFLDKEISELKNSLKLQEEIIKKLKSRLDVLESQDKQIERKRFTIQLIMDWSVSTRGSIMSAVLFVEKFNDFTSLEKIVSIEYLTIHKTDNSYFEKLKYLKACLPEEKFNENDNLIELSPHSIQKLRSLLVEFLNQLEVIMTAWEHAIADPELVEKTFIPMKTVNDNNSYFILKRFRDILKDKNGGLDQFTSITAFEEKIITVPDISEYKRQVIKELEQTIGTNIGNLGKISEEEISKIVEEKIRTIEKIDKKYEFLRTILSDSFRVTLPAVVKQTLDYILKASLS